MPIARCVVSTPLAQYLLEIMDRTSKSELVVECEIDESAGAELHADSSIRVALQRCLRASPRTFWPQWTVTRVREKKARANHIRTAWSTLEVLADDVRVEDIVAAVTSRRPSDAAGSR